jgi:hypothetical protein
MSIEDCRLFDRKLGVLPSDIRFMITTLSLYQLDEALGILPTRVSQWRSVSGSQFYYT